MSSHATDIFSLNNKTILLTGGTGSFGKAFIKTALANHNPHAIRIYSRDELKQFHLQEEIPDNRLRFFIGDVRDKDRLKEACREADVIIHAAAMKQVPACEYNPFEAVKTNILGATNIIEAALDNKVPHVMALSTDKAVNPVNLYGATKLCSDKLFIHANAYSGNRPTRFSLVRYGNVLGSRGSVIPLFRRQKSQGYITITDKRMTRFWISLEQAVELVLNGLKAMQGGEIFIPQIPSMRITDLANAIAPGCEQREIGIRAGEKIHEVLINEEEGRRTVKTKNFYIVLPNHPECKSSTMTDCIPMAENFIYSSDINSSWLSAKDLIEMVSNN
ncbi:UDP-N-acetylglucosamine 4,6-dehydratase (inverting) [Desulfocicer niacini]